jgi:hypothetical protein
MITGAKLGLLLEISKKYSRNLLKIFHKKKDRGASLQPCPDANIAQYSNHKIK